MYTQGVKTIQVILIVIAQSGNISRTDVEQTSRQQCYQPSTPQRDRRPGEHNQRNCDNRENLRLTGNIQQYENQVAARSFGTDKIQQDKTTMRRGDKGGYVWPGSQTICENV